MDPFETRWESITAGYRADMGIVKRLLEEQYAREFHTRRGRDAVCSCCIDEPALADFVSQRSTMNQCGFCGRLDAQTVEVDALFRYMAECVQGEWEDPIHHVGWDHGYDKFVEIVDSYDLLHLLDDPLRHDDLHQEFVAAFEHDWCRCDPYRLDHSDALILSWEHFRNITTTRRRFLVTSKPMGWRPGNDELVNPEEMLDAIGNAMLQAGDRMFRRTSDVRIVRARTHDPSQVLQYATELGPPPSRCARDSRMSPTGISLFYGAESAQTAIAEVRPGADQAVAVGTWAPSRELIYLDLLAALPIPSIFDESGRADRVWLNFLARFADDLAQPIDADRDPAEYVPTQIVTEYLRDHLRTRDGQPIDGIRYKSRLRENVGFGSAGVGWVHHVTRSARAAKLWGLVKPWAVRRRTWRRLLVPSMRPLLGRPAVCQARMRGMAASSVLTIL